MQGDKIVEKILSDANKTADEILSNAYLKSDETKQTCQDFLSSEKSKLDEILSAKKAEIAEKYSVLLRIEKRKMLLKTKQDIVKIFKQNVLEYILELSKKDTVDLYKKLIEKYAEKDEIVLLTSKKITCDDIEKLSVVKKLNLKVKNGKGDEEGFVLVGKNCDKNLCFKYLIDSVYEENQIKIDSILF